MEVLPATAEDVELAQTIDFTERPSKTRAGERLLLESSIFATSSVAAGSRAGSTVLMRPHDGRSRASSSKTTLSARDVLTTELRKRKLEQALASNGGASTLTSAATLGIVKRRLDAEDVEMPSSIKPAALASLVDYASDTSEDDG